MDVAEREMQVRDFVEEVWNGRSYETASDLYSENYVNPFGTGPSARVEPIRRYHQAFPDLRLVVEELIVAGDTVMLRMTFRGTDTGGHLGRPPTGRAVEEWVDWRTCIFDWCVLVRSTWMFVVLGSPHRHSSRCQVRKRVLLSSGG